MKRTLLILVPAILAVHFAAAQDDAVSGSVNDEKGSPLHDVFVEDAQDKTGAFTDSLGNFTILMKSGSQLSFSKKGYQGASAEKSALSSPVVLKGTGAPEEAPLSAKAIITSPQSTMIRGGVLVSADPQKVHGNQYLFDIFVHGFIKDPSGNIIYDPDALYNYDKLGGYLLQTKDNKTFSELSVDQAKYFTLFSNHDERLDFERVPAVDNAHYVEVLASGGKYDIYKLIRTRFVKSDYVNNGITAHGNDYDEFVDDADYYVFDVQANKLKKIPLRKKPVKEAFASDEAKVNKYLSDNSGDIDDNYLSKLGAYMNQ